MTEVAGEWSERGASRQSERRPTTILFSRAAARSRPLAVTRGYQAGGFNSVSTDANGGRFDPETITSYELGAKGRVPGAGISYSQRREVARVGPMQVTTREERTIPISPIVGGVAILAGVALIVAVRRAS